MFIEFPNDRTTYYLDQQFMLGESLLVAPVFAEDNDEVEFYLPAGTWTSFWSSEDVIVGPTWVRRRVPYEEIPVFVRENTVLALGKPGIGRPDYDYTNDLEVHIYGPLNEGRQVTAVIPSGKGVDRPVEIRATCLRRESSAEIKVEISKGQLNGSWRAVWHRSGSSTEAEGQTCTELIFKEFVP